jgi:tetratricopeptide (TPR) repeat protein
MFSLCLIWVGFSQGASQVAVTDISIGETRLDVIIQIEFTSPIPFVCYKLEDPVRIVIDPIGRVTSKEPIGDFLVEKGVVTQIREIRGIDDNLDFFVVDLKEDVPFNFERAGNIGIVSIRKEKPVVEEVKVEEKEEIAEKPLTAEEQARKRIEEGRLKREEQIAKRKQEQERIAQERRRERENRRIRLEEERRARLEIERQKRIEEEAEREHIRKMRIAKEQERRKVEKEIKEEPKVVPVDLKVAEEIRIRNRKRAERQRNRGFAHQKRGNIDRAERYYREAIELDPSFAAAHNDLGTVLADKGNYNEAKEAFLKALRLDPAFYRVHSNLARLFEMKGDRVKALEHWRIRAELGNPDDEWTRFAKEKVKELEKDS